jgi:biotin transport system substrate-specific component
MKSVKLSKMALWLALISVLSVISIPIGSVPITLQVFAFFLTSAFLSPVESLEVSVAYLVIGSIGVPVFAGAQGGIAVLLGPTGGYLLGFPLAAFFASLAWKNKVFSKIILLSLALLSIYIPGMLVLSFYLKSVSQAFKIGVLPFIWIDVLKIAIVYVIVSRLKNVSMQHLQKAGQDAKSRD